MHALLMRAPTQADDPSAQITVLGGQVNMLWVVIGAVLVIFMQAGFALVETGFCRAKHAAHVVSTNFAIFGLGFIGFFLVGFPLSLSAMNMTGYFGGLGAPVGSALIGSGQLDLPVQGRLGAVGRRHRRRRARPVPLHGGVHGHHGHDPDRGDGRAVEVGQLRDLGLLLRRPLLPAVRGVDVGRRLAVADWATRRTGARLRRLRRLRRGPRRGRCRRRSPAPSCSVPRIGKYGKDGKPRTLAGHHIPMAMLGTFILLFGWFGFNAASTFAATDVQFAVVADEHGDRRSVRRDRGDAVGHPADGQARPGDDGQRHAGRAGGDHRPVRLRVAGDGRASSG